MRASFNVLGPLLARCGEARVALPGGDNIGSRKVDMHLRGLEAMGAEVDVAHGFVHVRCDTLQGARVVLEFPSVGATENLMCAAVLAKGTTVIENAAREPEVTDLAAFLDRMGAQVIGRGHLDDRDRGCRGAGFRPRARSWPTASRPGRCSWHAASPAARSSSSGPGSNTSRSSCRSSATWACASRRPPTGSGPRRDRRLHAIDVSTLPHPGFATDFMPIAVALMTVAEGSAIVTENIYDGRFQFVDELVRMGYPPQRDMSDALCLASFVHSITIAKNTQQ